MTRAHFKFLSGDCDFVTYGGSFVRKVGQGKYHVMTLMNWAECCGEGEIDSTYNVSLAEVDVAAATDDQLTSALESCGMDDTDENGDPHTELCLCEILHSVGAKAPLHEGNGNNYLKLMTECRKYSAELTADPELYEAKMREPVNRLGSTAREYQQGDIKSAITRGVVADNPAVNLMAKMYGVTDENLKQVRNNSRTGVAVYVPSDETDPLAYTTGAVDCFAGADMKRGSNIAEAYTRGYKATVGLKAR